MFDDMGRQYRIVEMPRFFRDLCRPISGLCIAKLPSEAPISSVFIGLAWLNPIVNAKAAITTTAAVHIYPQRLIVRPQRPWSQIDHPSKKH
ncbi:MAG: hypothetical protein RLO08_14340 [Parvibaculaceae bacterium]